KVIELGINPQNVHAIEQGINPDLFFPGNWRAARRQLATRHPQLNEHRPMLLWVGRMVHVKRLDVLLAAASALRRRGREFVLCLAGDGPLRDRIARMVSDRQLSDCVHFVGPLPPESLGEWYRAADVTVLSSESEGLPNVLRESLACGTPFVSTDVGSVREIADERYAVLAPSGDSQTLADGVEVVLNGPHQEHARRYEPRTWDAMAADVVSLLRQCGANGGPAQTSDEAFCHVG
ncbi:MAG: glycosyltransferase, partial [Planctomycetaceae bacterium]